MEGGNDGACKGGRQRQGDQKFGQGEAGLVVRGRVHRSRTLGSLNVIRETGRTRIASVGAETMISTEAPTRLAPAPLRTSRTRKRQANPLAKRPELSPGVSGS